MSTSFLFLKSSSFSWPSMSSLSVYSYLPTWPNVFKLHVNPCIINLFLMLLKLLPSSSSMFTMYGSILLHFIVIFCTKWVFLFDPVCRSLVLARAYSIASWSLTLRFISKSHSVTTAFFDLSRLSNTRMDSLTDILILVLLPRAAWAFLFSSSAASAIATGS